MVATLGGAALAASLVSLLSSMLFWSRLPTLAADLSGFVRIGLSLVVFSHIGPPGTSGNDTTDAHCYNSAIHS